MSPGAMIVKCLLSLTNLFFGQPQLQWQGMDGLKGPVMSGTNFYIKRVSLYGNRAYKGIEHNYLSGCF